MPDRGHWPFFTERAQARAPQILAHVAVGGAALLVAPNGELVMTSGAIDLDLNRVAQLASRRRSFKLGDVCVHVAPVTAGWTICALTTGIDVGLMIDRLRKASSVMAFALLDGSSPGSSGEGSSSANQHPVRFRR